jgi:CheY-like chemotaxis protein
MSNPTATLSAPSSLPLAPCAEARPRVLIVDESRASDVAGGLTSLFESWGHDVHVARTWDDGLRQATAAAPDVLIVNRGSRKEGGLKPVRLIRLLPGLKRTPIIVVWNRLLYLLGNQLGLGDPAGAETRDLQPLATEHLRQAVAPTAA